MPAHYSVALAGGQLKFQQVMNRNSYSIWPMSQDLKPKRYRSDLVMVPLREVGLSSHLARDAEAWILSMTMDGDSEEGQAFWDWVCLHNHEDDAHSEELLDTYLFCDAESGKLLATTSLVADDRDVGATYGIPGIWMGGANVKGELRNRGIMGSAFAYLNAYISAIVAARQNSLQVNFFSSNEHMQRVGQKHGYIPRENLHIPFFGMDERWFSKAFQTTTS